jgi:hypothetical protein
VGLAAGLVIWNVVFDLWLGQAERQYLWQNLRYLTGAGPAISLEGTMAAAVRTGAWVATAWGAFVAATVTGAAYYVYRATRADAHEETSAAVRRRLDTDAPADVRLERRR